MKSSGMGRCSNRQNHPVSWGLGHQNVYGTLWWGSCRYGNCTITQNRILFWNGHVSRGTTMKNLVLCMIARALNSVINKTRRLGMPSIELLARFEGESCKNVLLKEPVSRGFPMFLCLWNVRSWFIISRWDWPKSGSVVHLKNIMKYRYTNNSINERNEVALVRFCPPIPVG